MRCWLFFNKDLGPDTPEAHEVVRFQETAKNLDIELYVLKPGEFDLVVDSTEGWSAKYQGRDLLHKPDLIVPRCGAETNYFTLAVLRHFERQGVPIVNGPSAIESVADKLHTLQIVSAAKLPTPKTILGKFPVDVNLVERELGFPVVVKKLKGTRGAGVVLCQDRAQFDDLANLLDGASSGADFLFQRYIKASHGRDVRVLVIDGKIVAAMERRATDGGFKSNISLGGSGARFEPPAEMAELAIKVARELQLDVAGIDILFDSEGYRVCEANSAPGFQGLERACGVNVPELVFMSMGRKFGIPVRHSERWERFIEDAARSALGLRTTTPPKEKRSKPRETVPRLAPARARTKPT
ncbi:ribosomal protein S6 glutaminyl transferase [alpha proteobacterium U9-1i]|nr:ribosomal protein S6 glutaminyl transferase [alpha proteobacterium U9-1i]